MLSNFEKLRCDESFNPRIVFKFIYKAMDGRARQDGTYHLYKVFSGQKEPVSDDEFAFSRYLSVYRFLVSAGISPATLAEAYGFYFGQDRFAEAPRFAEASLDGPAPFYFSIASHLADGRESPLFALICLNAFLVRRGCIPLVASKAACDYMFQMAICGVSEAEFDDALSHLADVSAMYNVRNEATTLEEIRLRVLSQKEMLQKKFGVYALYLIGSITKDYFDDYSDVDFLVWFEGARSVKCSLKQTLSRIVGRRADVMDHESPSALTPGVAEFAIKLF